MNGAPLHDGCFTAHLGHAGGQGLGPATASMSLAINSARAASVVRFQCLETELRPVPLAWLSMS